MACCVQCTHLDGCRDMMIWISSDKLLNDDLNQFRQTKYKLDYLCLQETHLKESGEIDINSNTGRKLKLFYSGINIEDKTKSKLRNYAGVGILVDKNFTGYFTKISDRLCYIKFQNKNRSFYIISCYAPTLKNSENNPKIRQDFYDDLDNLIQKMGNKKHIYIGGDFNAKVGYYANKDYKDNAGPFGKGIRNSNGEILLDFARRNNLIITNTCFEHKLAHRSTWTCEAHGNRINPIRNQIDYILCKSQNKKEIINARSYGGMTGFRP